MTTFVVATNAAETSAVLCEYLSDRVDGGDAVYAVHSLPGGEETDSEEIRDGEAALDDVASRLGGRASVETHQFVRGNDVVADLQAVVEDVDADEVVIGVRKRNPTAKVIFGSNAQQILLRLNVPMVVVPLERV